LGTSPTISQLLSQLIFITILVMGIMLTLSGVNLNKTVSAILAGLGVIGYALGFAFQDTTANFISGVLLIFKQDCQLGDIIQSKDGREGTMINIDHRVT
jgi:small-conductance mechanosensitive channel